MKLCPKCHLYLSPELFVKDLRAKDGLYYCCQECKREYDRVRRLSKLEDIRAYDRQRYKDNTEARNELVRKNYQANSERYKATSKQWKVDNPDKVREHGGRRRAIKEGAEADTGITRDSLRARDGDLCYLCEELMEFVARQRGVYNPPPSNR